MYQIIDEPKPGPLTHLVVHPVWPLFGLMFGGFWLALPWYVFNGFAMGCPARWKTLGYAIGGVALAGLMLFGIVFAAQGLDLEKDALPYLFLLLLLWKLGLGYSLFVLQQRSFEIYQYYQGLVRNGLPVVLLAFFFGNRVILGPLSEWSMFLALVLR